MTYYILGMMLFLLLPHSAMAAATATLDRSITSMGESVQLTIQVEGSADQEPDLSGLKTAFDILQQSQNSSYSLINGSFKRSAQWSIALMPKHEGMLLIPAISLGNMQTEPLNLQVLPRTSAAQEEKEDIFLQVSASAEQVYVQGQLILTVKLFRAVNLLQAHLSEPDMAQMMVKKLGEDKNYETVVSQRRFVVTERKYALFPQQSGVLHIPALQFDGSVASARSYGAFNQASRTVRLHSRSIDINVLPMPDSWVDGKLWLPASQLELREIVDKADDGVWNVGEPFTRTVELRVQGLTAEQLPKLIVPATAQSLKQYADEPVLTTEVGPLGVVGVRREKVALIPTEAGDLTLPALSVAWWDVQEKQMQLAQLAARHVRVIAAGVMSNSAGAATITQPKLSSELAQTVEGDERFIFSRYDDLFMWQLTSFLLALAWLMTMMLWWYRTLIARRELGRRQARAAQGMATLKVVRQRLERACQQHDLNTVATLFPEWAALVLKEKPVIHYSQLKGHASALDDAINNMELNLYAKGVKQAWSGDALLKALPLLVARAKPSSTHLSLKPLYQP